MIEKLISLHKNSYAPYSNFPVSAIVVMKDGKEFCGVNVENASYGAGICAERSAIVSAVSNGYKVGIIKKVVQCLSMLVAVVVSLFCFSYVAKTIRNLTGIEQIMQEKVTKVIEEQIEIDLDGKGNQRKAIEELELPDNIKDVLIATNNDEVYEALGIEKFTE